MASVVQEAEDGYAKELDNRLTLLERESYELQKTSEAYLKEYYESAFTQRMSSNPLFAFNQSHPQLPPTATDADYLNELTKLALENLTLANTEKLELEKRKAYASKLAEERLASSIADLQLRYAKRAESFQPPTQWFMLSSPSDSIVRVLAIDGQYRLAITDKNMEIWKCGGGIFGNGVDDSSSGHEAFRLVGIVRPGHLNNITAVLDVPLPTEGAVVNTNTMGAVAGAATSKPGTTSLMPIQTKGSGIPQPVSGNLLTPSTTSTPSSQASGSLLPTPTGNKRDGSFPTVKDVKKTILLGCADGQGVLVEISITDNHQQQHNPSKSHHAQQATPATIDIATKCTILKTRKLSSSAIRQGVSASGLIAVAAATGLYLFTPELETRFSWPADVLLTICKDRGSNVAQPETMSRGVTSSDGVTVVFVTTDATRQTSRVFALLSTGSLAVIEWLSDESKSYASWVADLGTRPPVDFLGVLGPEVSLRKQYHLACVSETTLWTFDPALSGFETRYNTGAGKGVSMHLICLEGESFQSVMVVITSQGILQMFQPGAQIPLCSVKLVTHLTDPRPAAWRIFVVDLESALICACQGSEYLGLLFGLDRESEKDAILLDLYYYTLKFAKDKSFTAEQASALFSIVKSTHLSCTTTPFINMEKDYANFKTLLVHHSVQRPPFSQKIFSLAEMKAITEYVTNTYFRHYLLYKYAFSKKMRMDFLVEEPVVNETLAANTTAETTTATPSELPVAAETTSTEKPPAVPSLESKSQQQGAPASVSVQESKSAPVSTDSPRDRAAAELNKILQSTFAPQINEMMKAINQKMAAQDEALLHKLKKLEELESSGGTSSGVNAKSKSGKN
ncbi:hypothetical protein SmJEL517_g02478 [Synchytrium microbalum]|uniref:Uncharacterized protein n=1 Tax=Synchytrium microbalum TaxID=1806994 RepID=A0A507CAR0_9FUNG|nr:uncharacterized protein SmJEL517_g02478 [Synchytrium microbalum]TPX35096.1 hypothetical protein SmJEL517_g02478 [Synchytrium microbalum]